MVRLGSCTAPPPSRTYTVTYTSAHHVQDPLGQSYWDFLSFIPLRPPWRYSLGLRLSPGRYAMATSVSYINLRSTVGAFPLAPPRQISNRPSITRRLTCTPSLSMSVSNHIRINIRYGSNCRFTSSSTASVTPRQRVQLPRASRPTCQ